MSAKQRYQAALAVEDWTTAESILRQGLSQSGDPHIAVMLGSFLRKRGRLEEAEEVMLAMAERSPTPELLDHLSLVQYERQNFTACEATLERLVALKPEAGLSTYEMLAKVARTRAGRGGGQDVMRRALAAHPGQTEFVIAYADTLPVPEAIAGLERHLAEVRGNPARTAQVLATLTRHRAPLVREARGEPPASGVSWPDTYQWPDQDLLGQLKDALGAEIRGGSRRMNAWLDLADIAVAEGDWEKAEHYLASLRTGETRSVADFSGFGRSLHARLDAMDDEEILAGFVAVERITETARRGEETIFMASDEKYFRRFTLHFLQQLESREIPIDVHVHLLDGNKSGWDEACRQIGAFRTVGVTLTAEASGAALKSRTYARLYYHAARYVRFYQELKRTQRPIWVLDADVEVLRDPRPLFRAIHGYDLALRTVPCEFHGSLKILAGCLAAAPTPTGLAFARKVAAYIVHWKNLDTWGWGVDQAGLISCYAEMYGSGPPRTLFLSDEQVNNKVGDTGMLRFLSGIDKYLTSRDSVAA